MPRITVTGATGHLGTLVIEELLRRRVPPQDLRATVRRVEKAAHWQEKGIDVRPGDFNDPDALKYAFAGTERLLVISTDAVGQRIDQHRNAVMAAREAGVKHIAYTSLVDQGAGESDSILAKEHRATEVIVRESGIPYTILRNTFYAEYLLAPVVQALDRGVCASSVGDAKMGGAARLDMAAAAAAVLIEPGHENKIYEITYPRAWDYREAVEIVSRVSGRHLEYKPVSPEELTQILQGAGVPAETARMIVGMEAPLRAGHLSKVTPDLERLLARPVTSLEQIARQMLAETQVQTPEP